LHGPLLRSTGFTTVNIQSRQISYIKLKIHFMCERCSMMK
jgi:hypothetical protein